MAVLLELCYLPPITWFAAARQAGKVFIEQHENYRKGSYRNRCELADSHGRIALSIPLKSGKHQQMPIREVEIDHRQPWARTHWRTIRAAYGKSPFFEFYHDELETFFASPPARLFDWNQQLLEWVLEQLSVPFSVEYTQAFEHEPTDLIDLRHTILPKGIQKHVAVSREPQPYMQVFTDRHGFLPNLSILDLLFCMGPEAGRYL